MKHELLVPVGDYLSLIAAINNGADAVYLGGKKFGARAFASNFTLEEIEKATKLCHLYGVKIYITVNTLVYEDEIDEALDYIRSLHKMGVDALIMQDIGLINLVHETFPNLVIHASTQMHNHSAESLPFLEKLGVKRVVFARELSLDYINAIDTKLEKEVFIHGSLCISYSGQCLFSSFILGRSGNRGECAGMCRLPYTLYKDKERIPTAGDYLLSPKDLCSIDDFKALMDSNVTCFKIEGRMKSPLYVGMVTKIYKTLMNQYENKEELKVNEEDLFLLKAIFNREYTKGYLFNDTDIMNIQAPNHQGVAVGMVTDVTKKKIKIKLSHDLHQFDGIRFKNSDIGLTINFMYDKNNNLLNKGRKGDIIYLDNFVNLKNNDEVLLTNPYLKVEEEITKKIPITMSLIAKNNKELQIEVSDNLFSIKNTTDYIVSKSINAPIKKERIKEILVKGGNTPFIVTNVNLCVDDDIFIPVGILKQERRNILNSLKELRENIHIPFEEKSYTPKNNNQEKEEQLSVLVRTKEQLQACLDKNVENIIVINKNLMQDNFICRIPRDNINHNYSYHKLLATDMGSVIKYPHYIDYFLNVTNHYTLDYLSTYGSKITISPECNINNIKDIVDNTQNKDNIEVYLYGNVELMIMKYCPINYLVNKDGLCHACQNSNYYLKDRNNSLYKIETNPLDHSTTILNHEKTNLLNALDKLRGMGIKNYRIELLEENYDETIKLIERVKNNE